MVNPLLSCSHASFLCSTMRIVAAEIWSFCLREGFGINGAYGLGGTEELGYRPMPGLTAVNIETTGRLGSLRLATINFKVWNMHQLNAVEALYFRLGYSMILEWGHTQYYKNDGTFAQSEIYGIPNPFTIEDVVACKR